MPKVILTAAMLALFFAATVSTAANAQNTQSALIGTWESMACELRPGQPDPDGVMQPTWLTRGFDYRADGTFTGETALYADPLCEVALVTFDFAGEYQLGDTHPAINGAVEIDYLLNQRFEATPGLAAFAEQMNALPADLCGDMPWEMNTPRNLLGIDCIPFGLTADRFLQDFDFVYIPDEATGFLFFGARHVDGRGFNSPADRPPGGLQVPLVRID